MEWTRYAGRQYEYYSSFVSASCIIFSIFLQLSPFLVIQTGGPIAGTPPPTTLNAFIFLPITFSAYSPLADSRRSVLWPKNPSFYFVTFTHNTIPCRATDMLCCRCRLTPALPPTEPSRYRRKVQAARGETKLPWLRNNLKQRWWRLLPLPCSSLGGPALSVRKFVSR